MSPENFTYWLQGFTEISQTPPNDKQWQIIQDHLQEVFRKVTPVRTVGDKTVEAKFSIPSAVPKSGENPMLYCHRPNADIDWETPSC